MEDPPNTRRQGVAPHLPTQHLYHFRLRSEEPRWLQLKPMRHLFLQHHLRLLLLDPVSGQCPVVVMAPRQDLVVP